jgi:hypothetical protein
MIIRVWICNLNTGRQEPSRAPNHIFGSRTDQIGMRCVILPWKVDPHSPPRHHQQWILGTSVQNVSKTIWIFWEFEPCLLIFRTALKRIKSGTYEITEDERGLTWDRGCYSQLQRIPWHPYPRQYTCGKIMSLCLSESTMRRRRQTNAKRPSSWT